MISLDNEIRFLEKYLHLEKVRFKNVFTISLRNEIQANDMADIYIPTMLIQPIIENAVKHGVSYRRDNRGRIDIVFEMLHENLLQVTVRDNGNTGEYHSSGGNSIAIKTIKERLGIYSRNGARGEYHLSITQTGATATITIPI
jgi:LytS/YehU family sensor histidine kinase